MKFKSFFYIPFLYFVHTRIASLSKLVSWGIIYVLPTFFILYNFSPLGLIQTAFIYALQAFIIYNFYEIGYIQNDCVTIKKEINPTLRLSKDELAFYERSRPLIYSVRLILGVAALAALHFFMDNTTSAYYRFVFASLGILAIYQIYNQIRNRFTLVLHFLLVSLRFLSFPLIFARLSLSDPAFLSLFFIFPVINLIERGSDKKFDIKFFSALLPEKSQLNSFRVKYYLIISIAISAGILINVLPLWVLYLGLYYFVYRLSIILFKL